jgi:hypothetical protein
MVNTMQNVILAIPGIISMLIRVMVVMSIPKEKLWKSMLNMALITLRTVPHVTGAGISMTLK